MTPPEPQLMWDAEPVVPLPWDRFLDDLHADLARCAPLTLDELREVLVMVAAATGTTDFTEVSIIATGAGGVRFAYTATGWRTIREYPTLVPRRKPRSEGKPEPNAKPE